MASYNRVMLIGNLTRDPEVRYTGSGTAVSTLGLAINRRYTTRAGESREETCFVDIDVWDRQAENCQKYLSKGSPVFVEGTLQMDEWEDRETGQRRSKLKVRALTVQFLSSPSRGDFDGGGSRGGGGGYSRDNNRGGGGSGGGGSRSGGGYSRDNNRGGGGPPPAAGGRSNQQAPPPPFPQDNNNGPDGDFGDDEPIDDIPF